MNKRQQSNKWLTVLKNFNLFILIKKEIQEKEKAQSDNLEREREFLERETLRSISGKITKWIYKTTQLIYL